MVDIQSVINNPYIYLIIGSLGFYLGTLIGYTRKTKKKFVTYEKNCYDKLIKENSDEYSPHIVINLVKGIKEIEMNTEIYNMIFRSFLPTFLLFEIICFIALASIGTVLEQVMVIFLIATGLTFFILLIIIIIWDNSVD